MDKTIENVIANSKSLIKNDLLIFEEKYIKNNSECFNKASNNFLLAFDDEDFDGLFLKLYNCINDNKEERNIKKKFNLLSPLFDTINIEDFGIFNIFKSKAEIINAYLLYFLLTGLLETNISMKRIDLLNPFIEIKNTSMFCYKTSDDIVNYASHLCLSLNIWLIIKNNNTINVSINYFENYLHTILVLLADNNLIYKKNNYVKKNHSIIFYGLLENQKYIGILKINYEKFEIYKKAKKEVFLVGSHYSLIYNMFSSNQKSGHIFKISEKEEFIKNLLDNWVYVDLERLQTIRDELASHYKIKNPNISFLELNKNIKNDDEETKKQKFREISIIQNILKLDKIIENLEKDVKVFLPFRFDFRGRLYYLSDFSPTFYKEFRYCIHKGFYDKIEERPHIFNNIIKAELGKYYSLLLTADETKNVENNILKESCIWILISIAETNKLKLGKEVHIKTFIESGMSILNLYNTNQKIFNETFTDVYDRIKIIYLINILKEIKKKKYKKWYISRDATASCYQHLINILGPKSDDALKWCNLNSTDTWYDPYSHIIDKFKENVINELKYLSIELFHTIFNRKDLKRTMMTQEYGAMYNTCWKHYFEDSLKKYNLSDDQKKEVEFLFSKFYTTLKEGNILFKNKTEEITNKLMNIKNYTLNLSNNAEVNYTYNETKRKSLEFRFKKKRHTRSVIKLTNNINESKMRTSMRANYVHCIDASLVRWYLSIEFQSLTIHDCFMTDYINTTFTISKLNEGMRMIFHDIGIEENKLNTTFSIFIIL